MIVNSEFSTVYSKTWDADLQSVVKGWDRSQVACKHEWNKWNGCLSNLVEVDWDFPCKKNILPPKERIALGTTIEGVLCSDWMIRWTKILSPCDVWVIIGSSRVGRIEPSQREQNPRYLGWSGGLLWQDFQGDQRGVGGNSDDLIDLIDRGWSWNRMSFLQLGFACQSGQHVDKGFAHWWEIKSSLVLSCFVVRLKRPAFSQPISGCKIWYII